MLLAMGSVVLKLFEPYFDSAVKFKTVILKPSVSHLGDLRIYSFFYQGKISVEGILR